MNVRSLPLPSLLLLFVALSSSSAALAQTTPLGRWRTIDDDTGKPKSVVEVYQARDGSFAGKVVEILDTRNGTDPVCDKCSGTQRNKPIKGMVILWGLRPTADGWAGGSVLDPEKGKTYKSKLKLLEGGRKLAVSGCIAFICRSQDWIRAP